MVRIECPWCGSEEPADVALLAATGGSFTCPECLTRVELVPEDDALPLAA